MEIDPIIEIAKLFSIICNSINYATDHLVIASNYIMNSMRKMTLVLQYCSPRENITVNETISMSCNTNTKTKSMFLASRFSFKIPLAVFSNVNVRNEPLHELQAGTVFMLYPVT